METIVIVRIILLSIGLLGTLLFLTRRLREKKEIHEVIKQIDSPIGINCIPELIEPKEYPLQVRDENLDNYKRRENRYDNYLANYGRVPIMYQGTFVTIGGVQSNAKF